MLLSSAMPRDTVDDSEQSRRFALEERCSQLESQLFAKSIEAADRKTQLDSLESAFRARVDEIETQLSATTALKHARVSGLQQSFKYSLSRFEAC
ncbi:unnamed protein product [Schistocephalus solidus]|uniref:Uncharacterized protein n=1 Tax=Schistocephalus solidus TaxID=70667 RepID=A0A183SAU1_SCHSO|nr:unnamed protein product [Schistocephalus solidus]